MAVDRDYLSGKHLHDVSLHNLFWVFFNDFVADHQPRRHRLLREQRLYRAAGIGGGAFLKGLAQAVKEHDADRLRHLADGYRGQSRAAHQRELVEDVAFEERFEGRL